MLMCLRGGRNKHLQQALVCNNFVVAERLNLGQQSLPFALTKSFATYPQS
jgi:hypothetical protein